MKKSTTQEVRIQVPYPEAEVYQHPNTGINQVEVVRGEQHNAQKFDKVVYPAGGGRLLYVKGVPYPYKGFPDDEMLAATNYAKRILVGYMRVLKGNRWLLFSMLWPKNLDKFLHEYNVSVAIFLRPFYLKERYYMPICWELWKFTRRFLIEIGVSVGVATAFGKRLATIIEADIAYRYRLEDLFSVTNKSAMMNNPRQQILRMVTALQQRDGNAKVNRHFQTIAKMITLALYVPRINRAFKNALSVVNFEDLQLDEIDRYHTLKYADYLFDGRSAEDRMTELKKIHKTKKIRMPKVYKINHA